MSLFTIHSTDKTRLTTCRDLLKRVKDLEDQVAAQASVSTTVAHATGTDDAPAPTSASAVDLITFSPVTNDPEASLGPDGHPADTLAEPQQARTPVPVQTALAHADPPVNMQRFAQREKKVVRFQLGEGGLKHSGALSSPDPLALGVTPQKNKTPSLAKSVTQKSAAALDKFKLGRLGEADHDEDEEHENIATVSNTPRLSAPLTHTNIAGPAKTVLHAASSMPNTLFAETPTKSAPVEPKSSPSAPSTSPLVYGPAPAVILSPAMPNTESEAPKSDAAVEDGSTSEQSKHATMTEAQVPPRDMDSASLVYADGVAGETSEDAGVRKSTRERKPKRDLDGEVYGNVRVKRARK